MGRTEPLKGNDALMNGGTISSLWDDKWKVVWLCCRGTPLQPISPTTLWNSSALLWAMFPESRYKHVGTSRSGSSRERNPSYHLDKRVQTSKSITSVSEVPSLVGVAKRISSQYGSQILNSQCPHWGFTDCYVFWASLLNLSSKQNLPGSSKRRWCNESFSPSLTSTK